MADRDVTPVTIHLDRQRPYRVRDEDSDAVWVGPGKATVPRWVAEHWGNKILDEPEQPEQADPVTGDALAGLGLTVDQQAALTEAGYADRHALNGATDDDLIAVASIGKATVRNLREALAK